MCPLGIDSALPVRVGRKVSLLAVFHRGVKFQNNKNVRQAKYSDQPGHPTSKCLHSAVKGVAYDRIEHRSDQTGRMSSE